MKILAVFTGGTIGSSQQGDTVSTDSGKQEYLLQMYRKRVSEQSPSTRCAAGGTNIGGLAACADHCMAASVHRDADEVVFVVESPFQVLSENITCPLLGHLISFLSERCFEASYDGIIVFHGTDTLQYSAAALAYCFGDLEIPMVLVSSNYVLEDKRANGLDNFVNAVEFIRLGRFRGVFVSYRAAGERAKFHRATRLLPHAPYSDSMESLLGAYYGSFGEDGFEVNPAYTFREENSGMSQLFRNAIAASDGTSDTSGVLWLRPYVGMEYPVISDTVRAVLHDTYHSGTICSQSEAQRHFAREVQKRQLPVFVCGNGGSAEYESKKVYQESGFHVLPVASPVAMYVKLWLCVRSRLAVSQQVHRTGQDSLRKMMFQAVSEDFVE